MWASVMCSRAKQFERSISSELNSFWRGPIAFTAQQIIWFAYGWFNVNVCSHAANEMGRQERDGCYKSN